jgi:hypothetical protein
MDGSCEHVNELLGVIKCWKNFNSYAAGSFLRRAQLLIVSYTGFLFYKFAYTMCDVHWLAEQMTAVQAK